MSSVAHLGCLELEVELYLKIDVLLVHSINKASH